MLANIMDLVRCKDYNLLSRTTSIFNMWTKMVQGLTCNGKEIVYYYIININCAVKIITKSKKKKESVRYVFGVICNTLKYLWCTFEGLPFERLKVIF